MACPWAESVARGGSVSGPYRIALAFAKGLRRGARIGLAKVGVYDDDIDYMAESVLRNQAVEVAKEMAEILEIEKAAASGQNNHQPDDSTSARGLQGRNTHVG